MQDSLIMMSGIPRTVAIKDRDYVVNPLTIDDMAEFENYIKSERVKSIIVNTKGLDPNILRELIKDAMSEPTDNELQSLKGIRFLLWRMLKDNKDVPPLDKMGQLVTMDNLSEIMGIVNEGTEPGNAPEPVETQ